MTDEFPKTWSALRFPYMRRDLLAYIKDLSDPDYQKEHWLRPAMDPDLAYETLANTIKEIIDARGYDSDDFVDAAVGGELFDCIEAGAIKALVKAILELTSELRDAPAERYMRDRRWSDVVVAAKEALALMEQR